MMNKKIKLVNMDQVMLVRRILPCQRWAFNLWEFNSAKHQMLRKLYDTTHKDVWRVMFKSAEIPPPLIEDRRPWTQCKAPCRSGKHLYFSAYLFAQV